MQLKSKNQNKGIHQLIVSFSEDVIHVVLETNQEHAETEFDKIRERKANHFSEFEAAASLRLLVCSFWLWEKRVRRWLNPSFCIYNNWGYFRVFTSFVLFNMYWIRVGLFYGLNRVDFRNCQDGPILLHDALYIPQNSSKPENFWSET